MNELHKTGSKIFVQVTTGLGRPMVKLALNFDYPTASAILNPWFYKINSSPLTTNEIHEMIYAFAKIYISM